MPARFLAPEGTGQRWLPGNWSLWTIFGLDVAVQSLQVNAASELGVQGEGSTQVRWCLSIVCSGEWPLLQSHAMQSLLICFLCLLSHNPSPALVCVHRCVSMGEWVCVRDPLREASEILVSFHLTQMARILTDFYSQNLWELLFPGLGSWAGEPPYRVRTPLSFRKASEATLSLLVLHNHM